jgi:hypothetical protein
MISVKLRDGLGNQLFQISAAYTVAKKHGKECAFNFDKCNTPFQGNPSNKYRDSILKHFNNFNGFGDECQIYKQEKVNYQPIKIDPEENIMLVGHFMSPKFFEDYQDELKRRFSNFKEETKDKVDSFLQGIPKDRDIVSLHVRRGDYITTSGRDAFVNLAETTDYYSKAIKEFDNPYFIVVSDDKEWVKENMNIPNTIYSPFNDDLEDLYLMTQVDGNIIPNSTFAWWGAFLNRKTKKVVAPNKWNSKQHSRKLTDIIPDGWTVIKGL